MVDEETVRKDLKEKEKEKRKRTASSSSSSSGSSTDSSGSSSSGSSSSGSGSSSSSVSSRSASPSPKKTTSKAHGRSSVRHSPRGPPRATERGLKPTIASSRRSPTPERRRNGRSTPSPRRGASPSPLRRRPSPGDKRRARNSSSPKRRAGRSTSRDRARRDRSRSKERKLPPPRQPTPPPRRLCVRNLSRNVTKAHLSEIFGVYGTIKTSDVPVDRQHPCIGRGYGYVEFESAEDADKAMKHMYGGQIDGQKITCELTHQPRAFVSNGGAGGRGPMSSMRYRGPPSPRRYRSPPPRFGFGRGTGGNMAPLGPRRFNRSSRSPRRRRSRS